MAPRESAMRSRRPVSPRESKAVRPSDPAASSTVLAGTPYADVACLTIVSKNYLAMARVLCSSFLAHHPGARFFVALADRNDGYIDAAAEQFTLLELSELGVPAPDVYCYQYNILEINTAIKPVALKQLLEDPTIEKIAYLDPDIRVFRPLDEVWDSLDDHSVVITPHMREPFGDGKSPNELAIIQSGTYNLGFIALKNDAEAGKLLEWWAERLYLDCVVDIPRGLFTDQKWIDLVPAYFESVKILRCPSYNVAYWNLHERLLTEVDGHFRSDGVPLAFFHFSGFNPRKPKVLSKHQDRHQISDSPHLEAIFSGYRDALIAAGYLETCQWPYAFKTLANDVVLGDPIHLVVRWCLAKGIPFPSPMAEPDDFCRFLMTPTRRFDGHEVAPIVLAILKLRPDVRAAFPGAAADKLDEGFLAWLNDNGKSELGLVDLVTGFGRWLTRKNSVVAIVDVYHSQPELMEEFPAAFRSQAGFQAFSGWLRKRACREYRELDRVDVERFHAASGGVWKVLNLFFGRVDLQKVFNGIGTEESIRAFIVWVRSSLDQMVGITEDEVELFLVWLHHNSTLVSKINLAYNSWIRERIGFIPNIFAFAQLVDSFFLIKVGLNDDQIRSWLVRDFMPSPLQHLVAHYQSNPVLKRRFPSAFSSQAECEELVDYVILNSDVLEWVSSAWVARLRTEATELERIRSVVNVAGCLQATTGMGESSRSMVATLVAGRKKVEPYTIPSVFTTQDGVDIDPSGMIFGRVNLLAETTIVVANADTTEVVNRLYPAPCVNGRRVGYWVWETETLPVRWASTADHYDEIWSPSRYAAKAIERTIRRPVRVVPHVVDIRDAAEIKGDRRRFGLPADGFIFAYFFDQKSFLERKNPEGVIAAFTAAFAGRDDVYLLLKVSTPRPGDYRYERIKAMVRNRNIIWVERSLNRRDVLTLMASVDAYVSLHRSEGFGLTMAEAMVLGKPTIGSAYSGNLDFMNDENAYLVKTERKRLGRDIGPYRADSWWGEPDLEDAARLLREVREAKEPRVSKPVELIPHRVYRSYVAPLMNEPGEAAADDGKVTPISSFSRT